MMRRIERESRGQLRPGQDLVAAGFAGAAGARQIALQKEEELRPWFSDEYIRQMQRPDFCAVDVDSRRWTELGATEWEAAAEGGIYTALWVLSGAYETGFSIDLRRIPVLQETIEVCERYELNPYRLLSENCLILAADNGERLAENLRREGICAQVIGRVQKGIAREVYYGDVHGYMERPRQDEIYQVLKKW